VTRLKRYWNNRTFLGKVQVTTFMSFLIFFILSIMNGLKIIDTAVLNTFVLLIFLVSSILLVPAYLFDKFRTKKNKQYTVDSFIYDKKEDKLHNSNDKDNFEGWFYDEAYDDFPIRKRFRIKYKDGAGRVTTRDINTTRYGDTYSGGFILAYCEMRNANRTFREDRILECFDLDTGESIKDLGNYLKKIYHDSDEYKKLLEKIKIQQQKDDIQEYQNYLLREYSTFMKVLVYILKCDGTYNAREKAIVKELFDWLEDSDEMLTDKLLHDLIKNYAIPSENTFKVNVTKLLNDNKFNIDLLELTKNIISTQKTIHNNEKKALEYIEKKIKG
jgi:hypothetical protein